MTALAILCGAVGMAHEVVVAHGAIALYPGTTAALVLTVDVLEGWYIQDREPTLPQLVPTRVVVEGAAGISPGGVQYPPPERKWFSFARRELRVYAGELEFIVPLVVAPDAEPGMRTVRVLLTYQACSDQVCRLPVTEELLVRVRVLPRKAASGSRGYAPWALAGVGVLALGVVGMRCRRRSEASRQSRQDRT